MICWKDWIFLDDSPCAFWKLAFNDNMCSHWIHFEFSFEWKSIRIMCALQWRQLDVCLHAVTQPRQPQTISHLNSFHKSLATIHMDMTTTCPNACVVIQCTPRAHPWCTRAVNRTTLRYANRPPPILACETPPPTLTAPMKIPGIEK